MRMQAVWNGKVVAQSDETIVVEGHHYFPPESIIPAYFKPSDHHSVCPWKGVASYFHVEVEGRRNPNAAWYYPQTSEAAQRIKGHIGFWYGVQVIPAPEL